MAPRVSLHLFFLISIALLPASQGQDDPPRPAGKSQELAGLRLLASKVGSGGLDASEAFELFEKALARLTEQYDSKSTQPVRKKLVRTIQKHKDKLLDQIGSESRPERDRTQLKDLWIRLQAARKNALELIRNSEKYPADSTHGSEAQPEVDQRVAAVRAIWSPPTDELPIDPDAQANLRAVNRQLISLEALTGDPDKRTQNEIRQHIHQHLKIRGHAPDRETRSRITYNLKILRSNARKRSKASPSERKLLQLTNEYRILMGLRALRLDDRLVRAAQAHCRFMNSSGKFAHKIPGHPVGTSPKARARRYGFTKLVGENIAKGCTTSGGALRIWLHSAGHHRNILATKFSTLGTGHTEAYWTQVFGHGK